MLKWIKSKFRRKQTPPEILPETPPKMALKPEVLTPVIKKISNIPLEESVEEILAGIKPLQPVKYKFNPSGINDFYKLFRNHQVETVTALRGHDVGQVNNPTGTGKTFIQKFIHVEDMVEKTKAGKVGVYVIAAHRLILCSQLFDEVIDLIVKCGLKTDLLYIGSGRYPFGRLNYNYRSYGFSKDTIKSYQTTSMHNAAEFVEHSKQSGHHTLIVATYHSFDCLSKINNIDICTFDEAHTTVEKRFTDNIETVLPNIAKKYFFTATRKVIGEHLGQNNFDFYGPVLYEMSPLQAVEAGEIVAPQVHIVSINRDAGEIDKKKNIGMLVETITGSFDKHEEKVKKSSSDPDTIAGKLLVTNSGLEEIRNITTDKTFIDWCRSKDVQVFSFSSKQGETAHNFKNNISREEILDKMNELKSNERAILFHFDILTEGIDLPAITGVMLLRGSLPFLKLLQNLGRACRLHVVDRKRLYSKEIKPEQYDSMVKPFSWVILPTYINENWEYVQDIITKLRTSYDIPLESIAITDLSNSTAEELPESVLDKDKTRKDQMQELKHRLELMYFQSGLFDSKNKVTYVINYIRSKQQC